MNKMMIFGQLKSLAQAAKNFSNNIVGELANATAEAIEEINDLKSDKIKVVSASIPTTNWNTDSGSYSKYYDIAVTGVSANDIAEVTVVSDSMDIAVSCGLCNINETLAGKIRIRAKSVPTKAINIQYIIMKGSGK